jgi:hypothetical protein
MKLMSTCAWASCCLALSVLPAFAQEGGRPASDRPVEIGVSGTAVLTWMTSGGDLRTTINFPVSERVSIEVFGGPYRETYRGDGGLDLHIDGFYGVQVRREIDRGRRAGFTPFLTFGAAGVVARDQTYDCSYATCRRRETTQVIPPLVGLVGGGVQYTVTPRLAVRVEVQGLVALVLPLGARVSVGISVPVGHRYPYPSSGTTSGSR